MRALITDSPGLRLGEAPEPDPRPDEALVDVRAVSLNRGEVRRLAGQENGMVRDGMWPAWSPGPRRTGAVPGRAHASWGS